MKSPLLTCFLLAVFLWAQQSGLSLPNLTLLHCAHQTLFTALHSFRSKRWPSAVHLETCLHYDFGTFNKYVRKQYLASTYNAHAWWLLHCKCFILKDIFSTPVDCHKSQWKWTVYAAVVRKHHCRLWRGTDILQHLLVPCWVKQICGRMNVCTWHNILIVCKNSSLRSCEELVRKSATKKESRIMD